MTAPDPNLAQRAASDPATSVWVAANAGSGKTKVLTDRVLRLLLSGTPPSRILCITYTKAAATEMQSRIFKGLSHWSVAEDDALVESLTELTGEIPRDSQVATARRLFTELLEKSPTLRVQTIHSFCQSVLARFPLEAGIPPHFSVLDERTSEELLNEARLRLLNDSDSQDEETTAALSYFVEGLAEGTFSNVLKKLVAERRRVSRMLEGQGGRKATKRAIYSAIGSDPGETLQRLIERHFTYSVEVRQSLINAAELGLSQFPGKNCIAPLNAIRHFMKEGVGLHNIDRYIDAMTATGGSIYAKFYLVGMHKVNPAATAALDAEREKLCTYLHERNVFENALHSHHLAVLAEALFGLYEKLKRQRGALDYDDLILRARRLLCDGDTLPWVLFKLDGGISHLLLDEAQDTSPEQWEITRALSQEFFAGIGASDHTRTLFVVGDRKQSIFRFQGADPEQFATWKDYFFKRAEEAQLPFVEVSLDISFRSTQAVLDVVDKTFAPLGESGQFALSGTGRHFAHREGQAGLVECWPAIPQIKRDKPDAWEVDQTYESLQSPHRQLAERIAKTIEGWIDQKRCLAATGKRITPGDILILLRSRRGMGTAIGQALREHGVPVAGLDRVELTEDLAVQDIMALGDFVLLPEDDLTLAALLKSPLFEIDEKTLFDLCHARAKLPVWEALRTYEGSNQHLHDARRKLGRWIEMSQRRPAPSEFFSEILFAGDGMQRMTGRLGEGARESLQSFLHQARLYEKAHLASLQGFLHWLAQGRSEIKRDMEQSGDAVRIMTVHGAKGLEAPIVFLPQMHRSLHGNEFRLLSHTHDGRELVLPTVTQSRETPLFTGLKEALKRADEEEELRLLYVALTRAKDELYLCSVEKRGKQPGWYDHARAGLSRLATVESVEEDHGTRLRYVTGADLLGSAVENTKAVTTKAPSHLYREAAPESPRSPVLNPSRLTEETLAAAAPYERVLRDPDATLSAVERGVLIHRLFEVLSGLPDAARETIGTRLLKANAPDATERERSAMLRESLMILRDPVYARVFGPGSLAEVAIAGTLEEGLPPLHLAGPLTLSGQVDRLMITPEDIWIIDYKTGELPPKGEVPALYRRQMEAYRALLSRIHQGREVHCALLYTSLPMLLPVAPVLSGIA